MFAGKTFFVYYIRGRGGIMAEKVNVVWKESDNDYLNKVFDILNIIFAFAIILTPLLVSAICLVGVEIDFFNVLIIIYISFILTRMMSLCLNWRFIRFRKFDLLEILALALFLMLCITEIINSPLSMNFILTLGYFFIFLIFIKLDKKYYKPLLYTFILTITACSIMGICDLNNSYMPGFVDITYPMSMQFWNPNNSAYITIMAILITIYVLTHYKSLAEQIIFWTAYVVLNVALFINGCFSAETAMFIGELFLLIYLWIKNKKCPYIILICLGISIAASFVWIRGYSTSGANYMFETLSFLDGKLGTTLTRDVSTFFDKLFGTGIIDEVPGSGGWDRGDLKAAAWREITASPKSVLFGYGILYNNLVRCHNVFLQIWLEYGLINLALYIAIWVVLLIRFIKTNFASYNIYLVALLAVVVLICHYFGGLDAYSFTYFACFLAVFIREVHEKYSGKKLQIKTEEDVINKIEKKEN